MQVSSYRNIPEERPGKAFPSIVALLVLLPVPLLASLVEDATKAISHQDYQRAISLLSGAKVTSAQEALLLGRAYFQTGQFEKAESALERAVALDPSNASEMNWLGRAQGMRAD